jgi:flavoprotein
MLKRYLHLYTLMEYTLQIIDKISAFIVDSTGKIVAKAFHLEGNIWNIFTPDYKDHLGRCEEGKNMILSKFQSLVEHGSDNH